MTPHTAAAAAAGPPLPSTTALPARAVSTDNRPDKSSGNSANIDNHRYVVSRNGVLLPWSHVREQYRPISTDDDCGSNSVEDINIHLPDRDAPMDAGALLQLLPRGAYTTARTVRGGTRVYQFDYHVRRLARSAESILEKITGESTDEKGGEASTMPGKRGSDASLSKSNHPRQHPRTPSMDEIHDLNIVDEAWEREMALNCIRSTIDAFCAKYHVPGCKDDGRHCDFRITLLATWERKRDEADGLPLRRRNGQFQSALYCHVGILPQSAASAAAGAPTTKRHISVLVHGHGRENALAKDSKWVIDRKKLLTPNNGNGADSSKPPPSYEEIILLNDDGELLEGTQTNFYVANEGSIITADEGVLYGSVRDSVLRVCRENGINVELRPPTLDDLQHASGVFITSTSRLVMPVNEVVLGDLRALDADHRGKDCDVETKGAAELLPASYCYPNCQTTENIRKWVLEDVETHSCPVYDKK